MNLDNLAKIWLNNLTYLERQHYSVDVCVDLCLSTFNLGYVSGEYEYLDKILELLDPSQHSLETVIGVLTWSRWQREKLPHQAEYRDRLITYLKDTDQYDVGLVAGIDD